jgi:hypothetical protein
MTDTPDSQSAASPAVSPTMIRRGWMVCDINGQPCGEVLLSEQEAKLEQRTYPVGCDYHVRPVRVTIDVLGSPPQPWFHKESTAHA